MMNFDPVQQPALAYVLWQQLWAERTNNIVITAGMGIEAQHLYYTETEAQYLKMRIEQARQETYSTWRGFDVRHIQKQQDSDSKQFDVFSAFDAATFYLDQTTFDFLTLRDKKDARLMCWLNMKTYNKIDIGFLLLGNEESMRLAIAFRHDMEREAQPHRRNIASGAYVLMREPLPKLDALIVYDYLRLVITPHGIGASIVQESNYIPFWWSPERETNTSQVWVPADVRFALDVLLASIWRDACIVKESAFPENRSAGRGYKSSGKKAKSSKSNIVRLPRVVYKSTWGGNDDREIVESIAKRAHTVRGHYRYIRDEYNSPDEAKNTALDHGYAPPPTNYTFVRPHQRGTGEAMPSVRRVICRGLQVAKTVLG